MEGEIGAEEETESPLWFRCGFNGEAEAGGEEGREGEGGGEGMSLDTHVTSMAVLIRNVLLLVLLLFLPSSLVFISGKEGDPSPSPFLPSFSSSSSSTLSSA